MTRSFDAGDRLMKNLRRTTAIEDYASVNTRQIWGVGTVNSAARKIRVEADFNRLCGQNLALHQTLSQIAARSTSFSGELGGVLGRSCWPPDCT